jgi:hypothetical protein
MLSFWLRPQSCAVAYVCAMTVFAGSTPTEAQSIGGNLSPLRGALTEGISQAAKPDTTDSSVAQAAEIGISVGATNNAGPSFSERSSTVVQTKASAIQSRTLEEGQLTLQLDVIDRAFSSQSEARNGLYALKGTFTDDARGFSLTASSLHSLELDEVVTESSVGFEKQWSSSVVSSSSFVSANAAYLDYRDVDNLFLEFANQDDRDRISLTAQAGIKHKLSKAWQLTFALGADTKRYVEQRDDFLIDRNNISTLAVLGSTFQIGAFSASLNYSPVYRVYEDPLFNPLLAHTFAAEANYKVSDHVQMSASAKRSLEETDFLDAKVVEEFISVIGITIVWPERSTLGLQAAYTHREFRGLERTDQKYEAAINFETPLTDRVKLTSQLSYLHFETTFAELETDQLLGLVGISHTF